MGPTPRVKSVMSCNSCVISLATRTMELSVSSQCSRLLASGSLSRLEACNEQPTVQHTAGQTMQSKCVHTYSICAFRMTITKWSQVWISDLWVQLLGTKLSKISFYSHQILTVAATEKKSAWLGRYSHTLTDASIWNVIPDTVKCPWWTAVGMHFYQGHSSLEFPWFYFSSIHWSNWLSAFLLLGSHVKTAGFPNFESCMPQHLAKQRSTWAVMDAVLTSSFESRWL